MKKVLLPILATLVVVLACGGTAKADSFTAGGITWTFTNEGSDGSGGFLVQLEVNATNPNVGPPGMNTSLFNIFSIQLSSGGNNATGVSLVSTSLNTSGWQSDGKGNVNQCGGSTTPFFCFNTASGVTITGGKNSGDYTFLFDVTGLSGAPDTGDVQAQQGSLPGSNGVYAISQSFGVGGNTSAPEPSSLMMLGAGLLGLALLAGRRTLTA